MRAPEFWAAPPGLAAGLLAPLAAGWAAAARWRRAAARPCRAPLPVVCVGNLVAGGAGKTPVVLSLAAIAAARGVPVHILSRGYGGRLTGPTRVEPGVHDAAAVGDEPLLLAAAAPCWVARDRGAGLYAAAAAGAGMALLDDGLQNPSVEKDLSLLVIDAEYGFGNGRVMPAGPLREPVGAGLARADAIVVLGPGEPPPAARAAALPILRGVLAPVRPGRFAGARVLAFAGIARPAKFFAALTAAGAELVGSRAFPDHHRYRDGELRRLHRDAAACGARLVTTSKDRVRLPPGWRGDVDVLEVELRWQDPAAVAALLGGVLDGGSHGYERSAARA